MVQERRFAAMGSWLLVIPGCGNGSIWTAVEGDHGTCDSEENCQLLRAGVP